MVKTFPSSTGGSRFDPWSIPGSERSAREGIGTSILHTPVFLGFPCGSTGKESACNAGDLGSIPGSGRFPWRGERLPTPVFRPGEFHGLYSPWGRKELDMWVRWVRRSTHLIAAQDALSKFPCFLKFSSVQFLSRVRLFVTS